MKTIGLVFGTRPEAVKFAPIIKALQEDSRFRPVLISTGQHREMLDSTMHEFGIKPDVELRIMRDKQTLSQVTHRILAGICDGDYLGDMDAVMVHGDTASTLAGALAGLHNQVPIIHVEAGLRSGNNESPYPEEANRKLVAQIASLHLAPTPGNSANLIREGIRESCIVVTGNTIVDALEWGMNNLAGYGDPALEDLDQDPRKVIVATTHRRESQGQPMAEIAGALFDIAQNDQVRIVVPLHLNPLVRGVMIPVLSGLENVTLVDPLPYLSFCRLLVRSDIILSDSSGAEEEGPALGKPTLVLRDITERHESILTGSSKLVGRSRPVIVAEVMRLLHDEVVYREMATAINPYGDGRATQRTIAAVAHFFGMGPAVTPFVPGAERVGIAA
ncbi:UDP-N-acetylglucosamine 2-epimerase (non-hydrolyzing) [Cryobacterium sp. TMT1-3]|uniref:UDP-N-acetylglucosamine 2-epimerase (non-hydrolyzing) n=1 Tax=Cryobacterium luteum TaxID=1424661 RepID=A0A1H8GEK9_9MICO|nr:MULTISPECIES: UDP-N-acetylglucosamine 2-epimerase (non-hydrolyzing) [Cryobacterium]TFB93950.1 UDP-N-acetylglucosamine 2-epimerase (non-hydrolyzing) [Cryobacterium luteum]TFC29922.1 UDP-N-acetylglucosamine 2-epimerase (non-hydrolyzing) [Cryobacterium sp. TMT1-3]SEN42174.1 UDP-N-acetylglucosamine 2-epimerase (non-hydrolysing) [Cryobacterium luteum]